MKQKQNENRPLFGHVHGKLKLGEKCYDVGVDTNEFKPISYVKLKLIMKYKLNQDHRYKIMKSNK